MVKRFKKVVEQDDLKLGDLKGLFFIMYFIIALFTVVAWVTKMHLSATVGNTVLIVIVSLIFYSMVRESREVYWEEVK